jgi:hypothetical protein
MRNAIRSVIPAILASATAALAADGTQAGGLSPLLIFFLAFFALIVVFQLIPGLLLFFSMLRGLFSPASRKTAATVGAKPDEPS